MTTRIPLATITLLATLLAPTTLQAEPVWLTDFEAAKAQAAKQSRPILVNVTGSDWCGWCIRLKDEVFSKAAFQIYAEAHVILLELDFPRSKDSLPKATAEQNQTLAKRYGIRGFPTILLLDAQGTELSRTGYRPGGPDAYVAHLKALLAQ